MPGDCDAGESKKKKEYYQRAPLVYAALPHSLFVHWMFSFLLLIFFGNKKASSLAVSSLYQSYLLTRDIDQETESWPV